VDFVTSAWSAAHESGSSSDVTLSINNTGDYNLTHCNLTFTNTLGASASFSDSDFTIENGSSPTSITAVLSGGSAGTDNSARFDISCTATAEGDTDTDSVTGSISISEGGGGGGSGGGTPITCGPFSLWPDTYLTGGNQPGQNISWWVRIDNGNTSQKFSFSFSDEVDDYCQVLHAPDESTPVNGFEQIRVVCIAPEEEINGHFLIKTDTGCEKSLAVIITSGDFLTQLTNLAFEGTTGTPISEATWVHWLWFIAVVVLIGGIILWLVFVRD
jgi:hypothetical protein